MIRAYVVALSLMAAMALQAQGPLPPALPADAPFTVAINTSTIESAPVAVAASVPGSSFRVINGGVRNVANGSAHAGTNAETQMLAVLPTSANVRMLFTVAEGLYRVVARKSAGINRLQDLRGKRIVTPRNTSAHYHLVRMLASAGVQESEVTLVMAGTTEMAAAIARRDADAISMWEPEAQNALDVLGGDATVFQDNKIYRELFSLYASTQVLNDPKRRAELVAFVRSLLTATARLNSNPQPLFPLIAKAVNQPEAKVSGTWKHHAFPAALPSDMLEVMVEEEVWMAKGAQRQPRSRAELAAFVDTSVLAEARR